MIVFYLFFQFPQILIYFWRTNTTIVNEGYLKLYMYLNLYTLDILI